MTQEERELLLKDLCARLPYDVKVHIKGEYKTPRKVYTVYTEDKTITYYKGYDCFEEDIENVKSYLRPMSSMTKEEEKEFLCISNQNPGYLEMIIQVNSRYNIILPIEAFDWLNAHHFDYRGLIEKGLALEAPEDMYKK